MSRRIIGPWRLARCLIEMRDQAYIDGYVYLKARNFLSNRKYQSMFYLMRKCGYNFRIVDRERPITEARFNVIDLNSQLSGPIPVPEFKSAYKSIW